MIKHALLLTSAFVFLTGCLQTRSDLRSGEQRQVLQSQVGTLQKTNADTANRIAELEEQIRYQNGRVEVLEDKLSQAHNENEQLKKSSNDSSQAQNQKIAAFQEALAKMEQNMNQLQAELAAAKAQNAAIEAKKEADRALSQKDPFEAGENHFSKKEYRSAILEYQKYREKSPKGKKFGAATYKMGVSFQELGMKDEAKTFYEEVVGKFPKSEEARKAKSRLQKLK